MWSQRFAKFALFTPLLIGGAFLCAFSTWFLFIAQSATGRTIALLGIVVGLLPATVVLAWQRKEHQRLWTGAALIIALASAGLLAVILINTPSGNAPPGAPARHRFSTQREFRQYRVSNIVPEIEQINLGFLLMPYLDPILTRAQAARVREFTLDIYREMERDRNFHQLGSAMAYAYGNLFGQRADAGHYYLYVPKHGGAEPLPVLIFLHGSAGNFKAYLWLWSKFAEEHGVAIIAPSFGFGNWLQDGAARSILGALEDVSTVVDIDEQRVILAGLSNGGLGVSQLATQAPDRFQGLVFLSPVMATDLLESSRFLSNWEGRPVLVMTGKADRRIPYAYVQRHVRLLDEAGVRVTNIGYPGEDHFLVFSRPEDVLHEVSNWLSQIE